MDEQCERLTYDANKWEFPRDRLKLGETTTAKRPTTLFLRQCKSKTCEECSPDHVLINV